mgnify:CR=1 FL=1
MKSYKQFYEWLRTMVRESKFANHYPHLEKVFRKIIPCESSEVYAMAVSKSDDKFFLFVNPDYYIENKKYFRGILAHELLRQLDLAHPRTPLDAVLIGDVVDAEVGTELVRNAAVRERRRLHLVPCVGRVLLEVAAALVHGPEIHRAAAVAGEVHSPLPPHRALARSWIVRRQRRGFGVAVRETPEVLRGSALVTLGVAALEWEAREEERSAGFVVDAVAGLGKRHYGALGRLRVQTHKLPVWKRAVDLGGIEDVAVRRPADHAAARALVGQSRWQATRQRHDVDLCGPLVGADEREQRPVG